MILSACLEIQLFTQVLMSDTLFYYVFPFKGTLNLGNADESVSKRVSKAFSSQKSQP